MANEVEKIWTVQSEINDGSNEVKTNTSRVSTASAKQRPNNEPNQSSKNNNNNNNNNNNKNNNNNNNIIKPGLNHYVGVQSRFQRKYYHKSLVVILIFLLSLITMALIMSLYFGRNANPLCKTKDCLRAASNLLQSMDFTVNPCDDFYQFTCGNWADDHPRPDSANSFDWFSEKQTKILRFIRSFLQLNGTASEPRAVKETRTMFKACMDTTQMDVLGLQPVIDYLNEFHLPSYPTIISAENVESSAMDNFDWIKSIAEIKKATSADIIVGFDIFPDPTNRTRNRIVLGTPETTSVLPFKTDFEKRLKRLQKKNIKDFDEFVSFKNLEKTVNENNDDDDDDDDTVSAYKSYMTEVMTSFVFFANPNANLDVILPLIKQSTIKIIKTTKFLIELAEEAENVTKKDVAFASKELINLSVDDFQNATDQVIAPNTLPIWCQYLGILFNSAQSTINLNDYLVLSSQADVYYLQHVMQFILDTPKIELELYIWWTIVEEMILHTTSDIRKLHNEYAKSITNLEGTTSRSLYCTSGVNQLMGMAVSYAIAQPNFLMITKPQVQTMIENIRLAFDHLVKEITWMDIGTKCSTLEKSHAMKSFVGFPEWILVDGKLDEFYADLKFNESTHLKNLVGVLRWQMNEKLKTLNSTEDLGWATTPTNVNAFHTFQANAITVPLAILQYPFYNLGLEALNYGAIGTILGHELTHGFDDSGRQFDKDGNMRQWWTNKTISEYINRTQCFIKQYDEYYIPEVEEHIDGELTLGENIADNGGLREAFYAYKLYTDKYGEEQRLPGFENFSHEQLLFISFGNLWCETQTTIATKWALEDSHCPGRIRLKGVLANSDEFKNAFSCHRNSKMISKKQCRIW